MILPCITARPTTEPRPAVNWMTVHICLKFGRMAVICDLLISSPLFAIDGRHIRIAQPCRRLDERVKYRLQIESRAADDLEYVGGGGLLLQRLAQLLEQPRVLDGDDGLGGEVL